jgi:hypothetical protein
MMIRRRLPDVVGCSVRDDGGVTVTTTEDHEVGAAANLQRDDHQDYSSTINAATKIKKPLRRLLRKTAAIVIQRRRVIVIVVAILILLRYSVFSSVRSSTMCYNSSSRQDEVVYYSIDHLQDIASNRLVVSLGTVAGRENHLLQTVESILRQSVLPKRILVHYSGGDAAEYPVNDLKAKVAAVVLSNQSSCRRRRARGSMLSNLILPPSIEFYPAQDEWRSATKLLGALQIEWKGTTKPSTMTTDLDQETLIVVADDDFIYSTRWLESLLTGHLQHPKDAVGLRGWRVRSDLHWGAPPIAVGGKPHPSGVWGSFPDAERYVMQGCNLCDSFQVGVLTGVHGIVYRPSFFDSDVFTAPTSVYLSMDDIWASGNLAAASVQRWVVPLLGNTARAGSTTVGKHLGQNDSVIDGKNKGVSRSGANDVVLAYFAKAWEKDNIFWSEKDAPVLVGLLPLRHWLSENVILRLYSVPWIRRAVGTWNTKDEALKHTVHS